ncbi:MAG: deoxyribose-phosphate aldolase [Rhodospirillaceae bacterium]
MIELGVNLATMVERLERSGPITGSQLARRAVPLLDLTCLDPEKGEGEILDLCQRTKTKFGPVAGICVLPQFVPLVREQLAKTGSRVHLATVVNFPDGEYGVAQVGEDAARMVAAGADEIDLVLPYRKYQEGERDEAMAVIIGCRATCGPDVTLKVILETGSFRDAKLLAQAARDVITEGADFLKTSTGRISQGATLSAAALLLGIIHDGGGRVGLKVSGGIHGIADVARYLALTDAIMGPEWATPANFRFGASHLLEELLALD